MKIISQFQNAFFNLVATKLRSSLALLGIMVGTASVVAMLSGGQLATNATLKQFKKLGTNLLSVSISSNQNSNNAVKLTEKDVNVMPKRFKSLALAAPYFSAYTPIHFEGHRIQASVLGVNSSLFAILKSQIAQGRLVSDLDGNQLYAVVGATVAKQIKQYAVGGILGQQLRLGSNYVTVVGVLKPWPLNIFMPNDLNRALMITLGAGFALDSGANISKIIFRLNPKTDIKSLQARIKHYITGLVPDSRLYFQNPQQFINSMKKQAVILEVFLGFIGGIALLVGGIGVMNIMLVSVIERKQEIGIRLAVGAKRSDIRTLFLVESVVLSVTGGILGVLLGEVTAFVIAWFRGWDFALFWLPPLIGFTVSALVGIFFGYFPAYKASLMQPIDALRSE